MSDVSVLSHEYQTTAELSQVINNNLIVLKKVHLNLPDAQQLQASQIALSRKRLGKF